MVVAGEVPSWNAVIDYSKQERAMRDRFQSQLKRFVRTSTSMKDLLELSVSL